MKTKILISVFLIVSFHSFSQDNKFSQGDFGIRYGVFYDGGIGQSFGFSRILKNNLEAGTSVTFSYQLVKFSVENEEIVGAISGNLSCVRTQKNSNSSFNVGLKPFLVYHFPVKSNLDIYAGGYVSIGISKSIRNNSETITEGVNYLHSEVSTQALPININGGAGAILGCRYFFYKNLAIGAEASLGFNVGGSTGKVGIKKVTTDSGSDNYNQGTNTDDSVFSTKQFTAGAGLAGSGGLNLTFYFSRKQKVQS